MPLNDDSVLMNTGLDSLCFAILVTRLEDRLGVERNLHASQHRVRQHQTGSLFFKRFFNNGKLVPLLLFFWFGVRVRTL